MTTVNPVCHHQSASSAAAWEKCQTLHRLAYREGIRVAEDSETLRVGTNWHKVHEVYYAELAHARKVSAEIVAEHPSADPASGDDAGHAYGMDAVAKHLDKQYAEVPRFSTTKDWALEKMILWTCFQSYIWYYQTDPIEVLASEVPFDLPIHNRSGLPLPMSEVKRVGKIDHIIRWHGMVGALERKSTTRDIEPGSDYWDMGKKDIQVSMYACAMRDMLHSAEMQEISHDAQSFGNTLYDVWRRPRTKPKMLTQGDTAKFIADGTYFGQKVDVCHDHCEGQDITVHVNGESCDVEPGKKGFAIRESVEMYAARLMSEILENPGSFFQRKEIVRTDAELTAFRRQTYNRYLQQKYVEKHEIWTENAKACRDPFNCAYIPICFGPGADKVCAEGLTPAGFKRIFTPLTVDGVEV